MAALAPTHAARSLVLAVSTAGFVLMLGWLAPVSAQDSVDWEGQGAELQGEDCTGWHFVLTSGGADIDSASLEVVFESGATAQDSGSQSGGGSWHFFVTSTGDRVASAKATFNASGEGNIQLVLSDVDCPEPGAAEAEAQEPTPEPEPEEARVEPQPQPEPQAEPEEAPADDEVAGVVGERPEPGVADVQPAPDAAPEPVAPVIDAEAAPAPQPAPALAVTGAALLPLLLAGLGLVGVGGLLLRRRRRMT